jgi:RNA polymerase sigma-70 factor (ECF subfamily)
MTTPEPFSTLLAAARSGDDQSLAKLLERVSPELRRRIEVRIGSKYRSLIGEDDVLQITFVEAFLQIPRFDDRGEDAFVAWLMTIAENNLRDAIRALEAAKRPSPGARIRRRAASDSYDTLIDAIGATRTTPSRVAGKDEAIEHLERAIGMLPPDYAEVVRALDIEQRCVDEIAEAMGRSPGAVYMLRSRAHDALRVALGSASQLFSFEG